MANTILGSGNPVWVQNRVVDIADAKCVWLGAIRMRIFVQTLIAAYSSPPLKSIPGAENPSSSTHCQPKLDLTRICIGW